jgi:hypothetical protein
MKTCQLLMALSSSWTLAVGQVAPTEANLRAGVASGGTTLFSGGGRIALSAPVLVTLDTSHVVYMSLDKESGMDFEGKEPRGARPAAITDRAHAEPAKKHEKRA